MIKCSSMLYCFDGRMKVREYSRESRCLIASGGVLKGRDADPLIRLASGAISFLPLPYGRALDCAHRIEIGLFL